LARIQFLLLVAVSLLSGLVIGDSTNAQLAYAVMSFVAVALATLILTGGQSPSPE
jgi:hypothetical protein